MVAARIQRPDWGGQGLPSPEERTAASSQGKRMLGYGCGREAEGSGQCGGFEGGIACAADFALPAGGDARHSTI